MQDEQYAIRTMVNEIRYNENERRRHTFVAQDHERAGERRLFKRHYRKAAEFHARASQTQSLAIRLGIGEQVGAELLRRGPLPFEDRNAYNATKERLGA